jgi:hypothetical protein
MIEASPRQLYPWKRHSSATQPWSRWLNQEFLKYEQKRIGDVSKWFDKFRKASLGQYLEEVSYYVTPCELSSGFKADMALKGRYNFVGLSALKNCLQMHLLMLIPQDKPIPRDYALIRIVKPRKDFIHDIKTNTADYCIVAEEFEELDPGQVYLDVPYEKRAISKFIKENLVNDELLANSFQPTISGAPYVVNGKGGVSLSMFLGTSSFSEELIKTLKLMQPPEFSDLGSALPTTLVEGKKISPIEGFKFHVAERNLAGNNFFSAFSSHNYDRLNQELAKRQLFTGEYSIACSLSPRGDTASELLRDVLSKFVKTEIMRPFNTDELKFWDIDLKRTQESIDEDLWLQVANQKQVKPVVVLAAADLNELRKRLYIEWNIICDSLGFKKNMDHAIKVYSQAALNNVMKVAQSIARDELRQDVSESDLKKSLKLFVENADALVNNPQIQHHAKIVIPERRENAKLNAVEAELSVDLLDITTLFDNVKGVFKDINELQKYVDQFEREGHLFQPTRGFYKWV